MDSFQLECFLKAADHLNFARAAEEMNITQPAISYQIGRLENEFRTKLFNRTRHGVSLTHDGEVLLQEASVLMIHLKNLQNKLSCSSAQEMMPFAIACTSEILMRLLPDSLYAIASAEPKVHPILKQVTTPQIVSSMNENKADVVLGLKDKLPKGDIVFTELLKTPLVCVCDGTHPLSECDFTELPRLADYTLILYRPTFCDSGMAALQFDISRDRAANEIFYCDDISSAVTLTLAGIGVTVIPEIFVPDGIKELKIIPLGGLCELSFGVYHRKSCPPLHRQFISILKDKFGKKA